MSPCANSNSTRVKNLPHEFEMHFWCHASAWRNRRRGCGARFDGFSRSCGLGHYDRALAHGLPIATGVIEGACRYLVQDRMALLRGRPDDGRRDRVSDGNRQGRGDRAIAMVIGA